VSDTVATLIGEVRRLTLRLDATERAYIAHRNPGINMEQVEDGRREMRSKRYTPTP
jgi:hypothetical protein